MLVGPRHLTLHKKDEFAARVVKVSHNAVWTFLPREGLRFRKRCSPSSKPALTLRVGAVAGWPLWQASLDPQRLIFINETWI